MSYTPRNLERSGQKMARLDRLHNSRSTLNMDTYGNKTNTAQQRALQMTVLQCPQSLNQKEKKINTTQPVRTFTRHSEHGNVTYKQLSN